MISHKHKTIFIHVPKCAGTTIEHMLHNITGFTPVRKLPGLPDYIDRIFPFRHYTDVIRRVRFLHGNASAIKTSVQNLSLFGKPTLKLYHKTRSTNDWLSGEFRKGTYQLLSRSLKGQIWNEYFKFSFVRNPYDRAVSLWAFFCAERHKSDRLNVSFPFFMKAVVNSDYKSLHSNLEGEIYSGLEWHAMPQVVHLKDRQGKIAVDFIGKIETLEEDCKTLSKKLDLSLLKYEGVRFNSSTHGPYQSYYTPELKELVYNYYKEDFERFGYSPEFSE